MTRFESWDLFLAKHNEMFKECLPPESRNVFAKVINTTLGGKLLKRAEETTREFVHSAHDYGYLRGLTEGKRAGLVENSQDAPNKQNLNRPNSLPASCEFTVKRDIK